MRRYIPSSQAHTIKKKLESELNSQNGAKSYSQSPQFNRTNYNRKEGPSPYHLSGSEIPEIKLVNAKNERKSHNLSQLLQHKKQERSVSRLSKRETQKDLTVIKINDEGSSSRKRTRRFQYMRQRQATKQNYQLGILHAPQEILEPKVKESESTQPAVFLPQKQQKQQAIEELHYHMVKTQQRTRNLLKD